MPVGRLVRWHQHRGFGFIKADDATRGDGNLFVHAREFERIAAPPRENMALAYRIEKRPDGRQAAVDLEPIFGFETDDDG